VETPKETEKPVTTDVEQAQDSSQDSASASETTPEVEEKATAPVQISDAKCKPLSDYPMFPWKQELSGLLLKLELSGVCQLFGTLSADAVKTGFSKIPSAGPFDDDLKEGISRVLVFPNEIVGEAASYMEFLFFEGSLYEISLHYRGDLAGKLKRKAFKKALGSTGRAKKDRLGRWYSKYDDDDMLVIQAEKKENKTKLKWVVFFEPTKKKEASELETKKIRDAENAYAEGEKYYNERKFNKALKSFREARRKRVNYGMAHAKEALLLVREEKFKVGKKAAKEAIDKGRDQRARAKAYSLLAVAALREGDKEGAMKHYRSAETFYPGDRDYSHSIEELESGEYSDERVAKTAARISCLGTVDGKKWTRKGLLARGNFPDNKIYKKALKKASKSKEFKRAKRNWQRFECR